MAKIGRCLLIPGLLSLLIMVAPVYAGIYQKLIDMGVFNTDEMAQTVRERFNGQLFADMGDAVIDSGLKEYHARIEVAQTLKDGFTRSTPVKPFWLQVDVFHINRGVWVPVRAIKVVPKLRSVHVRLPLPPFEPDPLEGFDLVPVRLELRSERHAPDPEWRSFHVLARAMAGGYKPWSVVFDYDKTVTDEDGEGFFNPIVKELEEFNKGGRAAFYVTGSRACRVPYIRHDLVAEGLPPGPILNSRLPLSSVGTEAVMQKVKAEKLAHMRSIGQLFDLQGGYGDDEKDIEAYQQMRIPFIYHIAWKEGHQDPEIKACYRKSNVTYSKPGKVDIIAYRYDPEKDVAALVKRATEAWPQLRHSERKTRETLKLPAVQPSFLLLTEAQARVRARLVRDLPSGTTENLTDRLQKLLMEARSSYGAGKRK